MWLRFNNFLCELCCAKHIKAKLSKIKASVEERQLSERQRKEQELLRKSASIKARVQKQSLAAAEQAFDDEPLASSVQLPSPVQRRTPAPASPAALAHPPVHQQQVQFIVYLNFRN